MISVDKILMWGRKRNRRSWCCPGLLMVFTFLVSEGINYTRENTFFKLNELMKTKYEVPKEKICHIVL